MIMNRPEVSPSYLKASDFGLAERSDGTQISYLGWLLDYFSGLWLQRNLGRGLSTAGALQITPV